MIGKWHTFEFVTSKNGQKKIWLAQHLCAEQFVFIRSVGCLYLSFSHCVCVYFFKRNSSFLNAWIPLFSIQLVFSHLDVSFTFVIASIYTFNFIPPFPPVFVCLLRAALPRTFSYLAELCGVLQWIPLMRLFIILHYRSTVYKRSPAMPKIPIFSKRMNDPINKHGESSEKNEIKISGFE